MTIKNLSFEPVFDQNISPWIVKRFSDIFPGAKQVWFG